MAEQKRSHFLSRPVTRLGRLSIILAGTFVILSLLNSAVLMQLPEVPPAVRILLIAYGWLMLACGLAAGVLALWAVIHAGERSWMVWITLLPGVFVLILLLGEFLVPH